MSMSELSPSLTLSQVPPRSVETKTPWLVPATTVSSDPKAGEISTRVASAVVPSWDSVQVTPQSVDRKTAPSGLAVNMVPSVSMFGDRAISRISVFDGPGNQTQVPPSSSDHHTPRAVPTKTVSKPVGFVQMATLSAAPLRIGLAPPVTLCQLRALSVERQISPRPTANPALPNSNTGESAKSVTSPNAGELCHEPPKSPLRNTPASEPAYSDWELAVWATTLTLWRLR